MSKKFFLTSSALSACGDQSLIIINPSEPRHNNNNNNNNNYCNTFSENKTNTTIYDYC